VLALLYRHDGEALDHVRGELHALIDRVAGGGAPTLRALLMAPRAGRAARREAMATERARAGDVHRALADAHGSPGLAAWVALVVGATTGVPIAVRRVEGGVEIDVDSETTRALACVPPRALAVARRRSTALGTAEVEALALVEGAIRALRERRWDDAVDLVDAASERAPGLPELPPLHAALAGVGGDAPRSVDEVAELDDAAHALATYWNVARGRGVAVATSAGGGGEAARWVRFLAAAGAAEVVAEPWPGVVEAVSVARCREPSWAWP
jgi:hypothetical protein